MKSGSFFKGLTLLGFIFLLTLFLFYRTGKFDAIINNSLSPLPTSPNGAAMNVAKADTLKPKNDTLEKLRLSSSKSIVLIEKKSTYADSIKNKYKRDNKKVKEKELLPGSKSAYIFRPRDSIADSLRKDSLIKQMLKPKQQ